MLQNDLKNLFLVLFIIIQQIKSTRIVTGLSDWNSMLRWPWKNIIDGWLKYRHLFFCSLMAENLKIKEPADLFPGTTCFLACRVLPSPCGLFSLGVYGWMDGERLAFISLSFLIKHCPAELGSHLYDTTSTFFFPLKILSPDTDLLGYRTSVYEVFGETHASVHNSYVYITRYNYINTSSGLSSCTIF